MRYAFSDCISDTDDRTLTCSGLSVPVEPQVFDLLHLLICRAGKPVSRDQIIDAVRNSRIVSDSAISTRIAAARKAFGDDEKEQRAIQTVSRRGSFSFMARGTAEVIVYDIADHVLLPGHQTWERFVLELLDFLSRD